MNHKKQPLPLSSISKLFVIDRKLVKAVFEALSNILYMPKLKKFMLSYTALIIPSANTPAIHRARLILV